MDFIEQLQEVSKVGDTSDTIALLVSRAFIPPCSTVSLQATTVRHRLLSDQTLRHQCGATGTLASMPNKQLIVPLEFDLYTAISVPGFQEKNEPIQGESASEGARNWCAAYELMHDAPSGDAWSSVDGVCAINLQMPDAKKPRHF